MKKLFSLLAALAVVVTLAGCQMVDPVTSGDGESPVITLVSGKPLSYEVDAEEPDWTKYFSVTDEEDGAITVEESMITWNTSIDMTVLGSYRMQLTVTDNDGNTRTRELTIAIVEDLTAPTVTLVAAKVTSFTVGFTAPDWKTYFSVEDETDGPIAVTDEMLTFSPTLDVNSSGVYELTIAVEDEAGNEAVRSIDINVN